MTPPPRSSTPSDNEPETVNRNWATARFVSGALELERPRGSDRRRRRPIGICVEEVPSSDHESRPVSGHEAEALLREPRRSTATEGQGSGTPQGEVRTTSRTTLSQEYSRWHALPVS